MVPWTRRSPPKSGVPWMTKPNPCTIPSGLLHNLSLHVITTSSPAAPLSNAYDLTMIAFPVGYYPLKRHNRPSSIALTNKEFKLQDFLHHFMKLVGIAFVLIHHRQTLSIFPKTLDDTDTDNTSLTSPELT